ncbi:rhodanese-like domain-containing protein [Candidatus Poseidoniales archaeon]|nr:rhodanese-like domain-containing protein [Candidatus Poseidoniales archaeon]MDB2367717.1 rhodanese-like domain-containing protein [Candidatus Poseidoniales archaeon]MDB2540317.1 rhodanese-like domain-containing protein [Candidatus Poseidoniales archaeon]MDB2672126.1 rhodanese-like domain-containing protein [Candidatus Poseidoniales archaeon]|tara:strand:- start:297 stop:1139 length:843 start_codon:yes stop_codon:yes gene_type:complete
MTEKYLNIAGYKFVTIPDRDTLRQPFKHKCDSLELKGTILLSHEGINIFIAGLESNIVQFRNWVIEDERFNDISFKESTSDAQPFNRMNVRLKNEIISVGLPNFDRIDSEEGRIFPNELHQRLSNNEDLVLLDTRNTYETRLGSFHNSIELDIRTFRAFPEAVANMDASFKDKQIVMFCTGGVRCEKASVIMRDAGFTNVRQLEGGILGYFQEVGGDHWNGECFVFDKRVALKPDLTETGTTVCFACREPLLPEQQLDPAYVPGISCSYCIDRVQVQTTH